MFSNPLYIKQTVKQHIHDSQELNSAMQAAEDLRELVSRQQIILPRIIPRILSTTDFGLFSHNTVKVSAVPQRKLFCKKNWQK